MPRRNRIFRSILLSCSCLLLLTAAALAQYGASLQGTVADQTGAAVSGAKVTATNDATGVSRDTLANDTGLYRISGLPPGTYTVTAESATFKKLATTHGKRTLGQGMESARISQRREWRNWHTRRT